VEVGQQPDFDREWYYNNEYYTALGVDHVDAEAKTVTMNYTREYYAPPTPALYPVSYEYTGNIPENAPAVPDTVDYEEGTEVIVADAPTLEGYTFSGWDKDNFTMPAEAVVIHGEWTVIEQPPVNPDPPAPATYPVSYEYTGNVPENAPAVPATVEYEEGAAVTVAAAPALEGYTFSGWDKGDFEMPAEAVVIRGEWTAVEQPPVIPPVVYYNYYDLTVRYVTEDGADLTAPIQEFNKIEGSFYSTEEKIFEGYTFVETSGDAVRGIMNSNKFVTYIYAEDEIVVELPEDDVPLVDIPAVDPPVIDTPEDEPPVIDLPDEDVPLADVPKTGTQIFLYALLATFSGAALLWVTLLGKKKVEEDV